MSLPPQKMESPPTPWTEKKKKKKQKVILNFLTLIFFPQSSQKPQQSAGPKEFLLQTSFYHFLSSHLSTQSIAIADRLVLGPHLIGLQMFFVFKTCKLISNQFANVFQNFCELTQTFISFIFVFLKALVHVQLTTELFFFCEPASNHLYFK